ncbi:alpha-L-glycero-D-manno-heptose alpha-1,3-glucosyltransferase, partial [bacterium]
MNILITSEFYYPNIGGAEKVAQIIAEGLVKKGHLVTVATTYLVDRKLDVLGGVKIEEFDITGNAAKQIQENKKGDIKRYQELLLDTKFDVLFQYAAQTWHTDIAFKVLDKITAKKILVPCGFSGLTTFL